MPLLLAVAGAATAARAAVCGMVTGLVHFAGIIPWIPRVMSEYGGLSPPVAWGVHLLLLFFLAGFTTTFAVVLWLCLRRFGRDAMLLAPCCWVASEVGRVYLFTGFPWLLLGYSQTSVLPVAQAASVVGVLGVSALVAWVNAVLALVHVERRRWPVAAATAVLLVLVIAAGGARVRAGTLTRAGEPVRVAAVQGNIAQGEKWDPARRDAILDRYIRLTGRAADAGASVVVWPESATPFTFTGDPRAERVRAVARERSVHLVFGSTDIVWRGDPEYFNAAVVVDPEGETAAVYHKQHLVPWGEYVPLADLLFFAAPLVENVGAFTAGSDPDPLPLGPHRIGIAICYEIIYPELVRAFVARGGQLLATVTNDAWFGRSSAPHQHFQMAVMRAIEGGRYLVRAANTGISGVVDPYGRVLARTALFETDVLTADVRWLDHATIYARVGDSVAWGCVVVTCAALAAAVGRRRPRQRA